MKKNDIQKALTNIEYLASDVNINEIASHIQRESLAAWLDVWRRAMAEQISNIKEIIENE